MAKLNAIAIFFCSYFLVKRQSHVLRHLRANLLSLRTHFLQKEGVLVPTLCDGDKLLHHPNTGDTLTREELIVPSSTLAEGKYRKKPENARSLCKTWESLISPVSLPLDYKYSYNFFKIAFKL